MEKKTETTIVYGSYRGLYRDNGKENGNYNLRFEGYGQKVHRSRS